MYVPQHFDLRDAEEARQLMRARSFATLASTGEDGAPSRTCRCCSRMTARRMAS
jgi:predicted FMN-binding regulatory protein PaiB